jgi:hypothetical protein
MTDNFPGYSDDDVFDYGDCWCCDGCGGYNVAGDDMACCEPDCICGLCDWETCRECGGKGFIRDGSQ